MSERQSASCLKDGRSKERKNLYADWEGFRLGCFAVIFQMGKVLLCRRNDFDVWNLPGGGMEKGETVDEAVVREVREETGLEVEVDRLVGVYSKPQKDEVVLSFLCREVDGKLTTTEESVECEYFDPDDLPPNTLPKHAERVKDALVGQDRAILKAQTSPSGVKMLKEKGLI